MAKVIPGEKLGVEEEYLPSAGTYIEDGTIISSNVGNLEYTNNSITVKNKIKVPVIEMLKKKEIVEVYGVVEAIMDQIAFVTISPLNKNIVLPGADAALHISNVTKDYIEKMRDVVRVGDIIKGQILKIESGRVYISISGNYGVISAFCSKCRSRMIDLGFKKGMNTVGCTSCSRKETRKMAKVIKDGVKSRWK